MGLPVSWFGSIGPESEPVRLALGCAGSGLFVVILAVVRMYLGWAYVGNRLLSATVECELSFSLFISAFFFIEMFSRFYFEPKRLIPT